VSADVDGSLLSPARSDNLTMVMTMERAVTNRTIKASEFKAKCLQLMDEVNETGEIITITKNGRPVAQLLPPPHRRRSPFGLHQGKGRILGDIEGPTGEEWEVER
jgi:prevent-host-death family protein